MTPIAADSMGAALLAAAEKELAKLARLGEEVAATDGPMGFTSYSYKPLPPHVEAMCASRQPPPPPSAGSLADSIWTYMQRGHLLPGFPRQCTPANRARLDCALRMHPTQASLGGR